MSDHSKKEIRLRVKDVGIQISEDPVPLSHECLDPQEVAGLDVLIYYGGAVEPAITANPKDPKKIVAAWQQDRIRTTGSALSTTVAHSEDGGKTWRHSVAPFQVCVGGLTQRNSDSWLSYSANGKRVFVSSLLINATTNPNSNTQWGVAAAYSKDNGKTWSLPSILNSTTASFDNPDPDIPFADKPTITCDANDKKIAYVVYTYFPIGSGFHGDTYFNRTLNGGKTWFPPTLIYDPFPDLNANRLSNGIYNDCQTLGNIIVTPPQCKEVLCFMNRIYAIPGATDEQYVDDGLPWQFTQTDIALIRSFDKGATWTKYAEVIAKVNPNNFIFTGGYTYNPDGTISGGVGARCRTSGGGQALFGVDVNKKNGHLYVVWQTGMFRADQQCQIALSVSYDNGHSWSDPVKVSRTPENAINPQAFTPFVTVTEDGYVAVLYYDFRFDDKSNVDSATKTDAWLDIYKEDGCKLKFVKELRLSKNSFIMQNGPYSSGYMTCGDYCMTRSVESYIYSVFIESFNGPFTPPFVFFSDPANDATVSVDKNRRSAPFVAVTKL